MNALAPFVAVLMVLSGCATDHYITQSEHAETEAALTEIATQVGALAVQVRELAAVADSHGESISAWQASQEAQDERIERILEDVAAK